MLMWLGQRTSRLAVVPVLLWTATGGQEPVPYQISVSVDLVELHAVVRDRRGAFVPRLSREHFQVFEDGVRQSIRLFQYEDVPVTVGLVVDHSGSMGPKLPDVMAAARVFAEASHPDDEMFVINFNESAYAGLVPPARFTNSAPALERAITSMAALGQTALYDAVAAGLVQLAEGRRDKKVLIVISDGSDNASRLKLADLLERIGGSRAIVYAIGIFDAQSPDRNPRVLARMARASGGDAFVPGHSAGVAAACSLIAREIRSQYTIGYVSTNAARSSAYRRIRLSAVAPVHGKLTVRTRSGYFARGDTGRARSPR